MRLYAANLNPFKHYESRKEKRSISFIGDSSRLKLDIERQNIDYTIELTRIFQNNDELFNFNRVRRNKGSYSLNFLE